MHVGAVSFTDSRYGKPNKTVHLSNVACNGSELALTDCDAAILPPENGRNVALLVDVAGVSCQAMVPSSTTDPNSSASSGVLKEHGVTAGLTIVSVLLVITVFLVIRYFWVV